MDKLFDEADNLIGIPPLLTDYYQITMCYAYWKEKKHCDDAVFDIFFRKNPFSGEFTVFAGLEDVLHFIKNFRFSNSDLKYIRDQFSEKFDDLDQFIEYLKNLNCDSVKIYAIQEGTVVFPRVPLITLVGPLAICQILETPVLNLINYASLVTTNAIRFRQVANNGRNLYSKNREIQLFEFGLRRAQGPNGGLTASKYCYIGGFDGTSNMLAGKLYGIPIRGTQAHSFVGAFKSSKELSNRLLKHKIDKSISKDLYELSVEKLSFLMNNIKWNVKQSQLNEGELVAFVAYASSFPDGFFALIDTYSVLDSGIINFLAVALALDELGYRALGCRIDSGDLSYLSNMTRKRLLEVVNVNPEKYSWVAELKILASNDLNEETIEALNKQGHSCDSFAIGTHLVTCQRQPALGCVCKLVELNGVPRIKLSQDIAKVNIPGHKKTFRLFGKHGKCIVDLMMRENEPDPKPGKRILCHHPFEATKRAYVTPMIVKPLHLCFWENGKFNQKLPTLDELREHLRNSIGTVREDHLRSLNPTPYKVSVTEQLYNYFHELWLQNSPIGDIE